ncbi:MAG: methyltransferase domain-containing protein [Chloroflexota bacterium]|nr:methyltransferase domain-containing protein [Chloroflexota bacterium]
MSDHRKDLVAKGYDALGGEYLAWTSAFADPARERMANEFSARLSSGARVLDLGCGPGLPSTRMLATHFKVTGVDMSETQLEAARRNVPGASFVRADITQVDFPPESFDGVTAFYAISHVPRDEHGPLFERIARWIEPGGLFLATLGAGDSPDWIGEWLGGQMFFSNHDAETNRRLLKAANFELLIAEIIETPEPEGPVPFLWVLAQRPSDGTG